MRIWKWLFLVFLFLPLPIFAQTTVNGNVTDAGAQAWFGGTWSAVLQPLPGNSKPLQYLISGTNTPVPNQTGVSGALGGSGNFTTSLYANTQIAPANSTWVFTVCPQATSPCFTQNVQVSATSPQTLTITPPAIQINMQVPQLRIAAYNDAEIVNALIGQWYWNLTSVTGRVCQASPCTGGNWVNFGAGGGGGGGTINGSIAAGQVAFGNAPNSIAGDPTFTYTPASGPATQVLQVNCNPNTVNEECGFFNVTGTVTGTIGALFGLQSTADITVNTPNTNNDIITGYFGGSDGEGSGTFAGTTQAGQNLSLVGVWGGATYGVNNHAAATGHMSTEVGVYGTATNQSTNGTVSSMSGLVAGLNENTSSVPVTTNYGFRSFDQSNVATTNYDFFAPATTAGAGTNWQYFAATGGTSSFDAVNTGPNLMVSTCSPVPVDLNATGCIEGHVQGTLTTNLTGNGTQGVFGLSEITVNSPNSVAIDFIGVHGEAATHGNGNFTSTDGNWAFWGGNSDDGGSWFNSTTFAAGGVSIFNGGTVNNVIDFDASNLSNSATAYAIDFRAAAQGNVGRVGIQYAGIEGARPLGLATYDTLYADSTAHRWQMNNNNAGALNFVGIATPGTSGHIPQFAANGIDIVDSGASSAIAGSIAANQVAFGSGANTITGSSNLTFTPSAGNSLTQTCSAPLLDSSGFVDCYSATVNGTITAPVNNGLEAMDAALGPTVNSPNTYSGDLVAILGRIFTGGNGAFTSTDGMVIFEGGAANGSNNWPAFSFFKADGLTGGGGPGTITSVTGFNSADMSGTPAPIAYDFWADPTRVGGTTAVQYAAGEGTNNPVGRASVEELYANQTTHRWTMNNNNGGALSLVGIGTAATSGDIPKFAANGIDIVDGGAAVSGTVAANQIVYGSGVNTITSNSNLTYTASQGGVLGSVCNPTLLDSSGLVDCAFIDAVGTLTSAGMGNGIEGIQGGVSLTMNSPLTYLGDIDGMLSNVTTSGTGTFNSTNGLASFDATATIGSNTWPNFAFYRADKVLSSGGTINNLKAFNALDQSGIATTSAYDYWAAPTVAGGLTAVQYGAGEGVAPVGIAAVDELYANSTTHRWSMNNNNGGALSVGGIVCSGQIALTTAAIGSGARATNTLVCTGLSTTTDSISCTFSGDTNAVTGYAPSATGGITLKTWVSANTINVDQVNNTSASITPGAATINCKGIR